MKPLLAAFFLIENMGRYLNIEQLNANIRLGKSVEQWLGYTVEKDYTILKWLRIDKEKSGQYSVAYIECFDDGDENFIDIYEFSTIDPDELYGTINTFDSVEEVLHFAFDTYDALSDKFVSAGMIQEEYRDYLKNTFQP